MDESKKIIEDIREKYPSQTFGEVTVERKIEWDFDRKHPMPFDSGKWRIFLPHQCDEWEIEGIDEAEKLAEDIRRGIEYLKKMS